MPGKVADRWQSRHNGIVFWILLSVGSPFSVVDLQRRAGPPALDAATPVGGEHPRPEPDVGSSTRAMGPMLGAVGVVGQGRRSEGTGRFTASPRAGSVPVGSRRDRGPSPPSERSARLRSGSPARTTSPTTSPATSAATSRAATTLPVHRCAGSSTTSAIGPSARSSATRRSRGPSVCRSRGCRSW